MSARTLICECGSCPTCRNRDYMRQRRATSPAQRAFDRKLNAARSRALTRLAGEYPERLLELLAEERGAR